MKYRKRMNRNSSKRSFRRNSGSHYKNTLRDSIMRGGYRL